MWHVQVAVLPLLPLLLTTLLLIFSSPVLAFLLTVFTIVYDKKKGGLLNASAGKHAGGVEGHWSVLVVAEVVAVALMSPRVALVAFRSAASRAMRWSLRAPCCHR